LRQLRRRGNLGTDLREEFPGATDQRHDDCPRMPRTEREITFRVRYHGSRPFGVATMIFIEA
jgi:hypothetical protein